MRVPLIAKFAIRTLGRNARRTLISIVGIGIGCAVAVFLTALTRGAAEMRVRSIAESGFGHARVVPPAWEKSRDNDLRLADWETELAAVRSTEGVRVAAPHARTTALLAFGTRVAGVEMLGVDPPAEENFNRLVRGVTEGRYLEGGDEGATVIGRTIAERLDVELGDDLLLTVVAEGGEMEYAMLRVVGIVSTGSRDIDASICHVVLEDVERLTHREGAGEITVVFDDPTGVDELASRLRTAVHEDDVLTWKVVLPAQGGDAASDRAFMNLFAVIVVTVVILGVASAQLTAILERRREFAVLIALGMSIPQVVRLVLVEALAIGVFGAAAGLAIATPLVYHTATTGINVASIMGGNLDFSGVLLEPIMYSDMGPWMVPLALTVALASTLVAALYPAWFAVRTDPTSALSLREA